MKRGRLGSGTANAEGPRGGLSLGRRHQQAERGKGAEGDQVEVHQPLPAERQLLQQRTGFCQFFENTTQLIGLLTKRQPRRFTNEEKSQLTRIFREIQGPFERHKGKRKNFLSYSFTLYKLCELMGLKEFLPYLPLLKAPANLLAADALWEKICRDLDYEFVRTS